MYAFKDHLTSTTDSPDGDFDKIFMIWWGSIDLEKEKILHDDVDVSMGRRKGQEEAHRSVRRQSWDIRA